jgi:prepilin-type N-terminal cleavage/methylation domain-containing protein
MAIHMRNRGFTLIELSIVLVIIGLIVGGVLVGQDLIRAATERAQISQIEKYNTAVNTFRGKYQALPGDMNATTAATFGFNTGNRINCPGQGDGNGLLETANDGSCAYDGVNGSGQAGSATGENAMFWSELTYANGLNLNLIEGNFQKSQMWCCVLYAISASGTATIIKDYLPLAKIGGNSFVYTASANGNNYYGIASLSYINGFSVGAPLVGGTPAFTVKQAYDIDRKMDDGFPQSGNVTAQCLGGYSYSPPIPWVGTADQSATPPLTSTCYDNGGNTGVQHYSTQVNNGAGLNCSLLFKFQ